MALESHPKKGGVCLVDSSSKVKFQSSHFEKEVIWSASNLEINFNPLYALSVYRHF